jgi:hypothetical protein
MLPFWHQKRHLIINYCISVDMCVFSLYMCTDARTCARTHYKMINQPTTNQPTKIMLFWVKALCGPVGRSQHFGEACCLHLQGLSDELGPRGIMYVYIGWQEGSLKERAMWDEWGRDWARTMRRLQAGVRTGEGRTVEVSLFKGQFDRVESLVWDCLCFQVTNERLPCPTWEAIFPGHVCLDGA